MGVVPPVTPGWKRMLVFSKVKESDVRHLERTPEEEVDFCTHPFECPICFRFSDHILRSHCCRQYVCHSCASRMRDAFMAPSCPHCRQSPFILVDPKPYDKVRSYRNSPKLNERVEKLNRGIHDKEDQRHLGNEHVKACSGGTARRLWGDGDVVKV